MSKYVPEGLGKQWYESLLDVVGEAGATIVEGQGGKVAGDAVRGLHKGWTQAAFSQKDSGSSTPPRPPPPPPPRPTPRYTPTVPPRPQPAPRPFSLPHLPFIHPAPQPVFRPAAAMPLVAPASHGSTTKTVLIVGGLGLGAVLVYLLARKS